MKQRILSLKEAYDEGRQTLIDAKVPDADIDAWLLLEHVAGISRAAYYAEPYRKLEEEQLLEYQEYISRRAKRVPLQHITGEQEFMGLSFMVNEHVLIPRQDTETLAEEALKRLSPGMQVLDLCTGSGCILLSLAVCGKKYGKSDESTCFTGADISWKALEVAKKNAEFHKTSAKWVQSDLFENIGGCYDLIVSNPPYIPTSVIEGLQDEVKCHDPLIALDGKEDGLYFYRKIIKESIHYLRKEGALLFEIGHGQADAVTRLMRDSGFYDVSSLKDLAGLDRVVMGTYNSCN